MVFFKKCYNVAPVHPVFSTPLILFSCPSLPRPSTCRLRRLKHTPNLYYCNCILQNIFTALEGNISKTKYCPDLTLIPKVVGFYKLQDDVKFILLGTLRKYLQKNSKRCGQILPKINLKHLEIWSFSGLRASDPAPWRPQVYMTLT